MCRPAAGTNELKHFLECYRRDQDTPYVQKETLLTVMGLLEEISGRVV